MMGVRGRSLAPFFIVLMVWMIENQVLNSFQHDHRASLIPPANKLLEDFSSHLYKPLRASEGIIKSSAITATALHPVSLVGSGRRSSLIFQPASKSLHYSGHHQIPYYAS